MKVHSLWIVVPLALAVVLGGAFDPPATGRESASAGGAPLPTGVFGVPAEALDRLFDPLLDSPPLTAAVTAQRDGDCPAALAALESLTASEGAADDEAARAGLARTVLGLHAYVCGQPARAEEELFAAVGSGGPLEDWRLFALAESAAAGGHLPVARAALIRLLTDLPASPLRPRALLRAAELAHQAGDSQSALRETSRARREELSGAEAFALEALSWQIADEAEDRLALAASARRLLVAAPVRARELGVESHASGDEWLARLSPNELLRRAERLLDAGDSAAALSTLDRVPSAQRRRPWVLLAARTLTAERRGVRALERLRSLKAESPREKAELEWARALAALDASRAVRGRADLPSAERAVLREEALTHLARTAAAAPRGPLAAPALRRLFTELAEDSPFEQRVRVLRRLREADPEDTTGARHLWELGWQEYERRNHTGAVGYWTELTELYPEHYYGRSGRYWTGRALAALGERERAERIFAEIAAADTTDFYRRHALARLGHPDAGGERDAPAAPGAWPPAHVPSRPWPTDPVLERALLLSDLGLGELALSELEAVAGDAEPRAAAAVEAVVLGRMGRRRDSIPRIRSAFPELGTAYQAGAPAAALLLYYPVEFEEVIRETASREGLPGHVVLGMIRQESAFDVGARSWAGAHGLMQVMPATGREVARRLGLRWSTARLREPSFNVRLGTAYFRQVLSMFDGDLELALAGYNGGPYRIKRLWAAADRSAGIDTFLEGLDIPESRTYVKRILLLSDSYSRLYPEPSAEGGATGSPEVAR